MNNENKSSEVKTKNITLSSIIAWVVGVGSALVGVGFVSTKPLIAVLYFFIAIILIPPVIKGIQNKLNFKISKSLKAVLVLILILSIGNQLSGSPSSKVTSSQTNQSAVVNEEAIKVTSAKLIADYKANEVSADMVYKSKLVKIQGTVNTIGKDITDTPYITFTNDNQYEITSVQCMFTNEQESELSTIKKNQQITLEGRVSGKLGNVIVRDCKIKN